MTITDMSRNQARIRSITPIITSPGIERRCPRHSVAPTTSGSRATLSIHYEGLLSPLLLWMTKDVNDAYLALEANGLKQRSESGRETQR